MLSLSLEIMDDIIISFKNASFRYDPDENNVEQPLALDGIDLDIVRGSFTVILGHNGSGKSTLAKLSNGILVPESGQVLVNGMDTADESHEFDVRKTVGVVFQNPDNQIVASIVEEDVAFGPENLAIPPAEIRERVDDALKAVGMYEYRLHEPHKLSGGQKQRVAIAGIMAMRPECIVLDEPTAMLDPRGREEVLSALGKLHGMGKTVVLITHYMDEAVLGDRVIVMNSGRIALDGTPREVFSHAREIESAGLELPESERLAGSIRKQGVPMPVGILSADEFIEQFAAVMDKYK